MSKNNLNNYNSNQLSQVISAEAHLQRIYVTLFYLDKTLLDGSSAKRKGGAYWASSNVDEEEKQPGLRDKKYEGYSNLKGTHE